MKRSYGHLTALAFALTALGSAQVAHAATDPAAPTAAEPTPAPAPEAAPEAPAEAVAAPAAAAASEPAPAPASPPPPAIALKTEEKERDSYGGPPLLFGKGKAKVKVGAFGSVGGGYTRFMGRDSGVASLEAALLLDHRFSIGLAGYGFTRTPRGPDASDGERREFGAGYGGVAMRYSLLTSLPVYPTFGVVIGGGAVNLHRERDRDDGGWDHGWDDDDDDAWRNGSFDPFFMVQPELAINANATRWLRLGANVGYRFAGGVGRFGLENGDLNGLVAGGTIAFGWF